jgi:hypothetical protein
MNNKPVVELFKFDMSGTPEARLANLDLLREGVVGVKRTAARDITPGEYKAYEYLKPPVHTFGTVEEYENGALNIFIKPVLTDNGAATMFIRVRLSDAP